MREGSWNFELWLLSKEVRLIELLGYMTQMVTRNSPMKAPIYSLDVILIS
jgi:hypothetical protein